MQPARNGLERPAIIVTDLEPDVERLGIRMYVALTPALVAHGWSGRGSSARATGCRCRLLLQAMRT